MNLAKLDEAIKKVCPIDGVNSAGRIDFKPEATEAQKILAQEIFDNWQDPVEAIELTKLEFKKRLTEAGKYASAKAILDSLPESKLEDWQFATCVESDNADIIAVLSALGIESETIFY
jgi:hypothetical protein